MQKLTFLLAVSLLTSFTLTSHANPAQAKVCFETVQFEPGFIALKATKESALGDWYQTLFDLKIVKAFDFPDGINSGVLMRRDEFVVEVFYSSEILTAFSKDAEGFIKYGFYTDANLPELKQCLTGNGIAAGRIYEDKNLKIDLLQLNDPNGNTMEIISRR